MSSALPGGASLTILLLFLAGCGKLGWGTAPSSQPTGPQVYALFVPKTTQGSGIAPGGGQLYYFQSQFPQTGLIHGILTGFRNPNAVSLAIEGPTGHFVLSAGQKTKPENLKALYGSETPTLPIAVRFVPDIGASNLKTYEIEVNYNIQ